MYYSRIRRSTLSAILAFLAAARRLSGRVATSEASQLWEESRSIRDDYRRQIERLTKTLLLCEARVDLLERRNEELTRENAKLTFMIEELKEPS